MLISHALFAAFAPDGAYPSPGFLTCLAMMGVALLQ